MNITERRDFKAQLAAKFHLLPRQLTLFDPCDIFLRQGGTRDEWIAVIDAVQALRGKGQNENARNGPVAFAQPARTNGGVSGRTISASDGQTKIAATPSPQANGKGRVNFAGKATSLMPPPVRPTKEALAAAQRAKERSALSVFDRELTHTGKRWGSIEWGELGDMKEDGIIAEALKKHIGGAPQTAKIRDLISPTDFAQILHKVRKHAA